MQPVTTKKAPPTRARAWIPLASFVVAVAIAAALLWLLRPPQRLAAAAPASAATHGSYHNRALFRRTVGGSAGAASNERPAIRGNVYDTAGTLIAGATVVATTFDLAGNVPSPMGSARSDAQGHFELPLPEGTYMVAASMPGYGPTGTSAQSGDTVSLVLERSGVLQGHVRDEHGQPVHHFTIDLVSVVPGDAPSPPPAWSKTFDSPDGSYRADQVPFWPVVVRAVADDHAPAFSDLVNVRAGQTQNVDLTLGDGCTLSGTVQDKQGAPLARVLVNAEERVTAGSATDSSLQVSTQAQSGDDGSFTLDHVPLGTVLVRGYDGDFAVTTVMVPVTDCSKLGKVALVMAKGGAITGVARRADGTPLAGARVSITERSIGFVNTTSGGDGRFRFDAVPHGSMRLELEQDGQRAMRYVEVKDGETVTQDMTLFAAGNGEVHGRVTAGQKPIAGARLMIASNHGRKEGIAMYFPVTGADGSYRVPSLPEGNYLVNVMSSLAGRGLRVNGGEATTVDIDMSPPATTGSAPPAPAPLPRDVNASP